MVQAFWKNRWIGATDPVNLTGWCGSFSSIDRCFKKFQALETLCSTAWNTLFHYLKQFVSLLETLCSKAWNTLFHRLKLVLELHCIKVTLTCLLFFTLFLPKKKNVVSLWYSSYNQAGNLPLFVAGIFMPAQILHKAVSYPRVEC